MLATHSHMLQKKNTNYLYCNVSVNLGSFPNLRKKKVKDAAQLGQSLQRICVMKTRMD